MVGTVADGVVSLEEISRFSNYPVRLGDTLHWDFLYLFDQMKRGLKQAFARYPDIVSIGVDTWGVDFGLIDRRGRLISNPVSYRDGRTAGMAGRVLQRISREELYALTGNQLMEINTLFQLYAMREAGDDRLDAADKLLFMPDLFHYFLCGAAVNEYTISTTSQLLDPVTRTWSHPLFERLGLPLHLMQPVVPSGTVLGTLLPEVVEETGGEGVKVVAVGAHDTASAVASLSAAGDRWAFLSSGTWSLMGIRTPEPFLTPRAMQYDFTNEGTVEGEIRFLKNITGLWLLQCVAKEFEAEGMAVDYDAWIRQAETSACQTLLPVNDPLFSAPVSMRSAIAGYARDTGQSLPVTPGDYMRCITRSLATCYGEVKCQLEEISGRTIDTLYVVGGGSRNRLLNRFTEEMTGCRVVVGEPEATAMGNIRLQASLFENLTKTND